MGKGLRSKIAMSDGFMTGHQIHKLRRRHRVTPDWAKDNGSVKALLLRAFPKLMTDSKQRQSAARWARVITMHYRMYMTNGTIAAEMKMSVKTIDNILYRVLRAAEGKDSNGRPRKREGVQTIFRGEQRPSGTLSPSQVQGAGASPLFPKDSIDADVQSPSLLPSRVRRASASEMSLPGAD